ncbi:GAF domain-containing sensor histidine kinase [Gaetbulibacter sp. M235]|uniref:GAF domain-containing sensor histidine kinase n=1 Tax=Gaetbulibacter sp. M235 TaxID=3126510 RepID=UPI00374FD28A
MNEQVEIIQSQLDEEKRKYELLQKVSFELTKLSPLTDRLNNILEFLDDSFNLNHTILLIPSKENTVLKVLASRGFQNDGIGAEIPFDFGIVGAVATKKKKMRLSRLSQHKKYVEAGTTNDTTNNLSDNLPKLEKSESLVALPLVVNNELVAVLSCESENVLFFSQKEEDLLMTLSQTIALSIQNAMVYEQLEDRVKRRTQELQLINETKDHLFSVIAHDLRSPLSALEGVSELFEFYAKKERYDKMLEVSNRVVRTTQNISQLLDNLLHWSLSQKKGIQNTPTTFSINSLLAEVETIFAELLENKQLSLSIKVDKTTSVHADYNMTFSIFRNLLSNAIKFTSKGGEINISSMPSDNETCICVRDSGVGIEQAILDKLFTLNSNTRRLGTDREKGSGLGLVLVKEFVKENNGHIRVETSEKGSAFYVCLPKV